MGDLRPHAVRLLARRATRILAGPAYLDGFGQGSATVLDDDGAVVAEWHSAGQAALLHTIWEDDDHVLALVFQDDAWAILRLDVTDGSVELAVEPVPDQGGRTPFVLPVRLIRPTEIATFPRRAASWSRQRRGRMTRDRQHHRRPEGRDDRSRRT